MLICSDHATCAGDGESEREDKDEETLAVNEIMLLGPLMSASDNAQK